MRSNSENQKKKSPLSKPQGGDPHPEEKKPTGGTFSESSPLASPSRRLVLKISGVGSTLIGLLNHPISASEPNESEIVVHQSRWKQTHDRIWLGGDYWANPMEDWRVAGGFAECQTAGGFRNIQLLTHQIEFSQPGATDSEKVLAMSVLVDRVEKKKGDGGAGFQLGIQSDIKEHRSNAFAKKGIRAGMIGGKLVLGRKTLENEMLANPKMIRLELVGKVVEGKIQLTLTARDKNKKGVVSLTNRFDRAQLEGNVALVSNYDPSLKKGQGARYRFQNWEVGGTAFSVNLNHRFGPILWSMYTLSDSRTAEKFIMTMNAMMGPIGEHDQQTVDLQLKQKEGWKTIKTARIDRDSWTAKFCVTEWNEKQEHQYRLLYKEKLQDGTFVESTWGGTIKANPSGRPLRLGALTCQNDYAFPYEPVADNVTRLDTDMLYFSGDQLYENHGGYGLIRDPAGPAILNYLRKFYQFGWSFRQAMKDRPTVCIPDDHDVFQGNIWGEGGAKMDREGGTSSKGGYREPARMVNVVHQTCAGHHPDFFDPAPSKQDISVYFGDLVYGDVSFAILGDRQFKSGPERVSFWGGRADHVKDDSIDVAKLDKPGLHLLGERQERFLKAWAKDWRGHSMKVLLSQTVFAAVATHHGGYNGFLKADLDSGGWPQTPRNEAINLLSEAMPLHINGDQHLTTLCQYGVEKQRDSCWSFCTPAIAAGYPRWWRPDEMKIKHTNRPSHGLANTGEYLDGFGNKVYVYAVGNPEVGTKKNRYEKAHQKGSGFGLVTIDTKRKTYLIESFRFQIDLSKDDPQNQFPGFPVTIHQRENRGENLIG